MSNKKGHKTSKKKGNKADKKKGNKSSKKPDGKGQSTNKTVKEAKSSGGQNKIALQKMLVGHHIETVPKDAKKKVAYIWQGDGIWEIRRLRLGTFTTHIQEFETPGLVSDLEEGWILNVPKIPASLLDMTLSFFRKIYEKHSSEVFLQFFFDQNKEEYLLHCPKQQVSGASVRYDRDEDFETPEKILVFEIHSHGSMPAFFSGTDDADEKDDRFFGVIGKVKDFYPEMRLRLSVGGRRTSVEVGDIFNLDESNYNEESFPKEWVKRIQKQKKQVIKRVRTRKGPPYNSNYGRPPGRTYDPRGPGRLIPVPTTDSPDYPGGGGFPPHSSIHSAGRSGGCLIEEDMSPQTKMFEQELRPIEPYDEEYESSYPVWPRGMAEDAEIEKLASRLGISDADAIKRLMESLGTDSVADVNHYLDQVVTCLDSQSDNPEDADYREELLAYLGLTGEDEWILRSHDGEGDAEPEYIQIGGKYFQVFEEHGKTTYREMQDFTPPGCDMCDDTGWLREDVVPCSCEAGRDQRGSRKEQKVRSEEGAYGSFVILKENLTENQVTSIESALTDKGSDSFCVCSGNLKLGSECWFIKIYGESIVGDTHNYIGEIKKFFNKISIPEDKAKIFNCERIPESGRETNGETETGEKSEKEGEKEGDDPREAIIRDWRGVRW